MNAEVKTAFTKLSTTVSVPGAESYDPIAYKVYYTNFFISSIFTVILLLLLDFYAYILLNKD